MFSHALNTFNLQRYNKQEYFTTYPIVFIKQSRENGPRTNTIAIDISIDKGNNY